MSISSHPALDLRSDDRALHVGMIETARRSMRGEIVVVFHATGWTHLYRIDARDGRTVHLLRTAEGDRRAELALLARRTLPIDPPKPDALAA